MSEIISIDKIREIKKHNSDSAYKKAMVLAQIHCHINDTEKERKVLYNRYYEAFNSNKLKEMTDLSREITEVAGKLTAFRKCENLIVINI